MVVMSNCLPREREKEREREGEREKERERRKNIGYTATTVVGETNLLFECPGWGPNQRYFDY